MSKLVVRIVTGNATKYNEMAEALGHFGIESIHVAHDITEIKEQDGRKVVTAKAEAAFAVTQQPTLVDDSGIYFERYDNFPGTYSKFLYNCIGFDGIFKLVEEGDRAHMHCFIGYIDAQLEKPMIFDAVYPGRLTTMLAPVNEDMPYAALFIPDGAKTQMSTLSPQQRSNDHRHLALQLFADWFNIQRS